MHLSQNLLSEKGKYLFGFPNETIARSRLQKEIWEDEGIIVARSLDLFISKLRKKLVNCKGYINGRELFAFSGPARP